MTNTVERLRSGSDCADSYGDLADKAADEIESLHQQLAECEKARDTALKIAEQHSDVCNNMIQQLAASKKEVNQLNGMMRDKGFGQGEIDMMGWYEEQLEASQVREAKLREALSYSYPVLSNIAAYLRSKNDYMDTDSACQLDSISRKQHEALAMPSDNTALKDAIKQAKREALLEAADWFKKQYVGHVSGVARVLRQGAKELK